MAKSREGRASKDRPRVPKHDTRYSQSLGHGLAILTCFSAEHPTRGIADMASALNMGGSTTHRYATTLVQLGYLEQNDARRYRLTARSADFGLAALGSMSLRARSREFLHELRRRTGCTVSLAILDGTEAMLMDRLRGWQGLHEIDLRLGPSARLPLHCTAIGKVLLAYLPLLEQRHLLMDLDLTPTQRGPNCITNKRVLRSELKQVLVQGYAVDDEELTGGLSSISVPVLDAEDDALAALDIAAPTAMFAGEDLNAAFGAILHQTSEDITAAVCE